MSSELAPPVSRSARYSDTENLSPTSADHDLNRLNALHHLSLLIVRSDDVRATLAEVARTIQDLLAVQLIGLSLGEEVWMIQTGRQDDTPGSDAADEDSEPIAERHSNLRRISDFGDDEPATRHGVTSRISIQAQGQSSGFLLIRVDGRVALDDDAIDLLERVGDTLAVAIERERQALHRNPGVPAVANVRRLLDIISHLATLTTVDAAIQTLLVDIAELLNTDVVSLIAPDPTQPRLFTSNPTAMMAAADELLKLAAAPVVRRALDLGQMQIGNITRRDDGVNATTNALAIPLLTRGESVGILILERAGEELFSLSERETASIVSRHLAFSLERERRVRAYSRQNLLLSLVERVTAFIARSTDADDLLMRMAREIRRTFGYDCSIAMVAGNRLEFRAIELGGQGPMPDWVREGIPLETGIMGRVARTGQPVFVRDVRADPSFLDTGRDTVSEIAAPIRVGDQVVGVLNVESRGNNPLESLDFEILLILANHIGIALTNRKLIGSEREARIAIEAIQRVSTIVAETLDPDESLRRIAATLADILGYPVVSLALIEGRNLVRRASYGYDPDNMPEMIGVHEGVSGRVVRTGQPVLIEDTRADADYLGARVDLTSEVCVPIRCNGEIIGILNVEGNAERPVTYRDLHLLTTFAEHAGVLLNNAQAYAALSREATLDPMTGVPNLRYFQQELHEQVEQDRRENQQLSLAVIDLDDLKEVNDTYGHLVGDQVLRELARRMMEQLRGQDLLARYAGDEFVAIFPDVDERGALDIASRLLDAARSEPFEVEDTVIDLSLSIGVATYPQDAATSTDLLRAADMAMYVAKESGKNRVSSARQSEHIRRRSET